MAAVLLGACMAPAHAAAPAPPAPLLPPNPGLSPIPSGPWAEVLVSVTDPARTAQFFTEIGGYEIVAEAPLDPAEPSLAEARAAAGAEASPDAAAPSARSVLLSAPGAADSRIRLVAFENAGPVVPTRPGARAWDTGCFWSIMVRAKGLDQIVADAIALGWWIHTPVADLTFGDSVLKVVVLQGPDGVQVQAYERLAPPLPPAFPAFDRISQPFNLMQMVEDREAARVVIEEQLGFSRFWFGPPSLDASPTFMPLGIPYNLTTSVPYLAGIFAPTPGETGRLEVIEIDGLDGHDFSGRCRAPNLGILAVSYPVADLEAATATVAARGGVIESGPATLTRAPYGTIRLANVRFPDGGRLELFEILKAD